MQGDDADLLVAMGQGDVRAARALSDRLTPRVYAQAFRMVGRQDVAEDIAQDALMRLWNIAPDWDRHRAKVTTWIYRVTANLCIDYLRKQRFVGSDELPDVADTRPSVADQMHQSVRHDALQSALMDLPERQRQAVVLRHLEELSNPEIAQVMDLTVEAVESLVARGKRKLTEILSPKKAALGYADQKV